jgi:hypothetical protein
MFMGPLDVTKPWQMSGVAGVRGFPNHPSRTEDALMGILSVSRPLAGLA